MQLCVCLCCFTLKHPLYTSPGTSHPVPPRVQDSSESSQGGSSSGKKVKDSKVTKKPSKKDDEVDANHVPLGGSEDDEADNDGSDELEGLQALLGGGKGMNECPAKRPASRQGSYFHLVLTCDISFYV